MKFLLEVDPDDNPDAVGEMLRSTFFDEKLIHPKPFRDASGLEFEREPYRETGCYSTYEWQGDVLPLEPIHTEEFSCQHCEEVHAPKSIITWRQELCRCTYEAVWTRAEKVVKVDPAHFGPRDAGVVACGQVTIECRYFWDGDGTLAFRLPDGRWLVNTDCKKDHDWKIVDSEREI